MRLGLAELRYISEQFLPGLAPMAELLGRVLCSPLFSFSFLQRICFLLAFQFLPPLLLHMKSLSSVSPHLHCSSVMKAGRVSEGRGLQWGGRSVIWTFWSRQPVPSVVDVSAW